MDLPKQQNFKIDCSHCPIRHSAICARCEPDELEELNTIKYYRQVPRGQDIARRGERTDYVASVVSGVATLTGSLEDGRTQVVGILLPSDFLGRPGRAGIGHDVTAATDVTLCCFRRAPFEKMLIEVPHLRDRLLEMALDELDAARDWMLLLGRKTARERMASFLVLMLRRAGLPEAGVTRIDLPLSREMIANYLGLTIETVSRQLTALRKDGIVSLDGARTIVVLDPAALTAESGFDDDSGD